MERCWAFSPSGVVWVDLCRSLKANLRRVPVRPGELLRSDEIASSCDTSSECLPEPDAGRAVPAQVSTRAADARAVAPERRHRGLHCPGHLHTHFRRPRRGERGRHLGRAQLLRHRGRVAASNQGVLHFPARLSPFQRAAIRSTARGAGLPNTDARSPPARGHAAAQRVRNNAATQAASIQLSRPPAVG